MALTDTIRVTATDRRLAAYQAKIHQLVAEVRDAVAGHVYQPAPARAGTAADLLAAVPSAVCVRLMEEAWAARAAGYSMNDLTSRLGTEGRLVFELVLGAYDTGEHQALPADRVA